MRNKNNDDAFQQNGKYLISISCGGGDKYWEMVIKAESFGQAILKAIQKDMDYSDDYDPYDFCSEIVIKKHCYEEIE